MSDITGNYSGGSAATGRLMGQRLN